MNDKSNKINTNSLAFTGERFVPDVHGNIELEHIHRYLQACEIASGRVILDIASGEGYGSAMLADRADKVIGVDISVEAVNHARKRYKKGNLEFMVGSCSDIPLPDASVDMVVSFETIEHHDQQEQMIREVKRVLRQTGILLISSPDKYYYTVERGYSNPYHAKELYQHEFKKILGSYFKNIAYFGQRVIYGSAIFSESLPTAAVSYFRENETVKEASGMIKPLYWIALAADIKLPDLASGVFEQPINESEIIQLWSKVVEDRDSSIASLNQVITKCGSQIDYLNQAVADRDDKIANLNQSVADRDDKIAGLNQSVADRDDKIAGLNQSVANRDDKIASLNQLVADRDEQLVSLDQAMDEYNRHVNNFNQIVAERDALITILNQTIAERDAAIVNLTDETVRRGEWALRLDAQLKAEHELLLGVMQSNSWRLTLPLREARKWLSNSKQQAIYYYKKINHCLYRILPFSERSKKKMKFYLYGHIGFLFKGMPGYENWERAQKRADELQDQDGYAHETPDLISIDMKHAQALAAELKFRYHEHPTVSIIIPVYNGLEYTMGCLISIKKCSSRNTFEIIIIDDDSTDDTQRVISSIQNIHFIKNSSNLGFIRSCNKAAKAARGKYLLFLNNDTQVMTNWLDALVDTFTTVSEAGLVGSKLIYPDRRLQEAGGIIWKDSSGWNYGHSDDPLKPEYNYLREVDYCSGASLMLPEELFRELGGFDERYVPAYYEDVDLAFAVRARGKKALYQPFSQVIHFEGISSGTDVTSGTKAFQEKNKLKFHDKWSDRLVGHRLPGEFPFLEKDRPSRGRILVIDATTLTPDKDAGSVVAINTYKIFIELGYKVSFIPANLAFDQKYTADLQAIGVECLYKPYWISIDSYLEKYGKYIDIVVLYRAHTAWNHIHAVRTYCPHAKVIFNTVDLHFLREERQAALTGSEELKQQAAKTKDIELSVMRTADLSIVLSTSEYDFLKKEDSSLRLVTIPLLMPVYGNRTAFCQRHDILFIGGYEHPPNIDAVKYFVTVIWPLVHSRLPAAKFYMLGSKMPEEVKALAAQDGVAAIGFVADVGEYFNHCRLSVAPLRFGAGIKGKIATSASYGLPCVATTLAVEGMGMIPGRDILVADTAEDFAEKVIQLYTSEEQWMHISKNALRFIEDNYSLQAGKDKYVKIFLHLKHAQCSSSEFSSSDGVAEFESLEAYRQHRESQKTLYAERETFSQSLLPLNSKSFVIPGYCRVCDKKTEFTVDYSSSYLSTPEGKALPNWRETVVCKHCGLNNRLRASLDLFLNRLNASFAHNIYITEQLTPMYSWLSKRFPYVTGSEYLGAKLKPGVHINGIRHEDLTKLSFESNSIDFILSFDVLEHVPDYKKAFEECYRCLKPGGRLFFSVPFNANSHDTLVRARLGQGGDIEHLCSAEYHGNPARPEEGSLCFYHFGWDIIDDIKSCGFVRAYCLTLYSTQFGYLGDEQLVFVANKCRKINAGRANTNTVQFVKDNDSLQAGSDKHVSPPVFLTKSSCANPNVPPDDKNLTSTDYTSRLQQEISNYRAVTNVHDLPAIFHYWSQKYLLPKMHALNIQGFNEFYLYYIMKACRTFPDKTHLIGSIGAGNCELEVELAHAAQQAGLDNIEFHCFDINPHMLSRGAALACDKGVADSMRFMQIDIQSWDPAQAYSICIANQALHHFVDLEILFAKIKKAIHPDGVFLTHDMIGRNGHMLWPEALEIVNSLWEKMPDKYKFNHQLKRFEMNYHNWDCSQESFEGIRSQDILPLLIKNFHFEVFFAFKNVINIFIDRGFGHNFDVNNAEDTSFIDYVARLDEEMIAQGVVKPTQILAAMRTTEVCSPKYYNNMTPEFCMRVL